MWTVCNYSIMSMTTTTPTRGQAPNPRFLDLDHLLNRKRERFKVFEVEPESNRDDVIINLIIN